MVGRRRALTHMYADMHGLHVPLSANRCNVAESELKKGQITKMGTVALRAFAIWPVSIILMLMFVFLPDIEETRKFSPLNIFQSLQSPQDISSVLYVFLTCCVTL